MKKQALLLSGAIVMTAAVSATLAASTYQGTSPVAGSDSIPSNRAHAQIAQLDTQNSILKTQNPTADDVPHWRIMLVDQSSRSPEFAQFLQQLRQAVQKRDAAFIHSVVTPQTKFGFGEHRSIHYLNPDNPDSPFWSQLEKAISPGCTDEANTVVPQRPPQGTVFSCPSVFRQFDEAVKTAPEAQKPLAYETSVIVVGKGVNVRSQSSAGAPSIAVLSNEIVQFDQATFEKAPQQIQDETLSANNLDGWTAVILPDRRSGYVSNRYAYRPLGYRAIFAKVNRRWVMQVFVAGD